MSHIVFSYVKQNKKFEEEEEGGGKFTECRNYGFFFFLFVTESSFLFKAE